MLAASQKVSHRFSKAILVAVVSALPLACPAQFAWAAHLKAATSSSDFAAPVVNLGSVKGTTLTVTFSSSFTAKGVSYRWWLNGKAATSSSKVTPLVIKNVGGDKTYSVQVSESYRGVTKTSTLQSMHLQLALCGSTNWKKPLKTFIGTYLNLARINLSGCGSEHLNYVTDFTGSDLSNANFAASHFSDPLFNDANLSNANFSSSVNTSGGFTRTNLHQVNFANAGCQNCVFVNSDLSGADLHNGNFRSGAFTNCHMEGANIDHTTVTSTFFTGNYATGLIGTPIGLTAVLLINGNIVGRGAHLHGADLGAQFMVGVILSDADLSNANLAGSNISATFLDGANFTGANLSNVNLNYDSVIGTQFAGATMTGVVTGSLVGTPASLPSNWTLNTGYFMGPGADLSHAVLTGSNLQGVNLQGAILTGVLSGGVTGTPASLPQNWVIKSGFIIGPGAALLGLNLDGMDFSGLDLTGTTFAESSLVGAKFDGVKADGAVFQNSILDNASLVATSLVGAILDSASLKAADFTNADLTNGRFNVANVTGTKFAGAVLTGVNAGRLTGTPASLPSGWTVTSGVLSH